MISIRSSVSSIYVNLELVRGELLKFKATTETFERILDEEAPSFGRKKFLKLRNLQDVENLGEDFESLPVDSKSDVEKIKEIVLNWNHAISGLKKYLMDIFGAVKRLKMQLGKVSAEDKEAVLEERVRINEDLVELAVELELYLRAGVEVMEKAQGYLDNPDPSISRMADTYNQHLQKVMELIKEENFLQMLAKLRNLKSNPRSV